MISIRALLRVHRHPLTSAIQGIQWAAGAAAILALTMAPSISTAENVAAYHQWYNDIQRTVGVTSPTGVPGSAVKNAAKATVFGIELEQTIAPIRYLSMQLNYDSRIRSTTAGRK